MMIVFKIKLIKGIDAAYGGYVTENTNNNKILTITKSIAYENNEKTAWWGGLS
jgi:hypothetical protein